MQKNSTVKRLMKTITGKYKVSLIFVFLFIIISALSTVIGSMFIQRLVDDYISPLLLSDNPIFSGLLKAILIMGTIYLIGVAATLLYNRMMVTVAQGVLKKVRDDMFSHMQSLPIGYFDTHTHGDIMSRYTNDTDTLREMISQSLPQALSSIVTVVTVAAAMLALSIPLSLLVFTCVAVMLFIVKKVGGRAAGHFIKQQKLIGGLNGYIEEMINGQKVVKVFCHEEAALRKFDEKNEELKQQVIKANRLTNILLPITMNIGALQYVLIALVGGALALGGVGGMTLGTIAAFLTLSKSFSAPIGQVSTQINAVITALAGAERIFNLMDEQPETDAGYVTLVNAKYVNGDLTECAENSRLWAWKHPHGDGSLTYTEVKGDVRFFDVDFGYSSGKTVLHDISIYAKPGQKIAFVGATGAGKTTITNLINRFYDISDGKIRFDGININKIKKNDLRRSLGVVLQDTHLFTGTISDNIRYGKLDATEEEIMHAAQLANAHDFIMRLPDGYNTVIAGDGGHLSGGQRQLLAIARAAVADPPVMILDEATSSIDTRTEAIVQKGMDGLMAGRTVFVIAHRLSTVKNSNAIMVMDQGRIIERGDHDELIEEKGKYYQLYTGAFAE
ncbi:ABC transporter ATP-binding protein [Lacrimispora sp.]|uniref:ABC transporter ATP-binding protein n=1 Tax=Lacrimispora sp. TaxID=2719234 RepID=UPI0028B1C5C6|nr:ABC transporter ATP-binding protein [Lacrimispora sp.]